MKPRKPFRELTGRQKLTRFRAYWEARVERGEAVPLSWSELDRLEYFVHWIDEKEKDAP